MSFRSGNRLGVGGWVEEKSCKGEDLWIPWEMRVGKAAKGALQCIQFCYRSGDETAELELEEEKKRSSGVEAGGSLILLYP